jgi:cobalt/nickel transport system permease protein
MDARVKLLSLGPFALVLALQEGLRGPGLGLLFSLALVGLARLPAGKVLQRLLVVNFFMALLWLLLPFSYPGRTVLALGPLQASAEGLRYCLGITLKCNAIVLATMALLGTSEAFSLAHALVHLRAPRKLVYMFFFFYRYISVMHQEYLRLRQAMRARGFRARAGRLHTYRALGYLVGMLMLRSYGRSQRIYQAMLARGFRGHFPIIHHFHLHRGDVLFGLLMGALSGVLLWF